MHSQGDTDGMARFRMKIPEIPNRSDLVWMGGSVLAEIMQVGILFIQQFSCMLFYLDHFNAYQDQKDFWTYKKDDDPVKCYPR